MLVKNRVIVPLVATATALVVVHSLGRFAYTPLLPLLVADGVLSLEAGAAVATWNYVGYLLGAMLAIRFHRPSHMRRLLPVGLLLSAVTTLLQGVTADLTVLTGLRWVNGVTNGVVFVQAPALMLEWLSRQGLMRLSGLVYLGVGGGLLLSSGLAWWPVEFLYGIERWWPMAAVAIPCAVWSAWVLMRLDRPVELAHVAAELPSITPLFDARTIPLFLSYAGAGLGYILPMTFLPVVAQEQLPSGHWLLEGAWSILALCTLGSAWLWNRIGAKWGDKRALLLNYVLQALGVAAPLIWVGAVGVFGCAVLLGGTFLGTVLLTQRHARTLHPHQGPRISAAMTTLYACAQLTGPWLAQQWLLRGGSMTDSYLLGVGALLWSVVWLSRTPVR